MLLQARPFIYEILGFCLIISLSLLKGTRLLTPVAATLKSSSSSSSLHHLRWSHGPSVDAVRLFSSSSFFHSSHRCQILRSVSVTSNLSLCFFTYFFNLIAFFCFFWSFKFWVHFNWSFLFADKKKNYAVTIQQVKIIPDPVVTGKPATFNISAVTGNFKFSLFYNLLPMLLI